MTFIAVTYGYNQYQIFNTNVSTFPLLDSIVSTCLDDINNLLNSKLPLWDEQINNYNLEEDVIKKNIKKLETDKFSNEEKGIETNKGKDEKPSNENNNKKNNSTNNAKNTNSTKNIDFLDLLYLFIFSHRIYLDKFYFNKFFELS